MSTGLSDNRRALVAALTGVTSGGNPALTLKSGRAVLGYNSRLYPAVDSASDVYANGPLCIVGPTTRVSVDSLRFGPSTVPFEIIFAQSKQKVFTCEVIDDLTQAVIVALCTEANFGVAPNPSSLRPRRIELNKWEYLTSDSDGIIILGWQATFPDP